MDIVQLMTFPLQNIPLDEDTMGNLFETHLGEFGAIDVAHDYLNALSSLANSCWTAAYEWEVKEIREKSLSYYLELLRVDVAHECETRFRVPFILLYLNRDDDAYAFIRYWLNFGGEEDEAILARHARSREGDWLYPVEPSCRFNDVFKDCPKALEEDLRYTLPYMVALAFIKLRIVASHDAIAKRLDFVFDKTDGKRIQEVRPMVQEILAGSDASTQRQHLNQILDLLQHGSTYLFDSILDYEHISETCRSRELHNALGDESLSIHDFVLLNGLRSFSTHPPQLHWDAAYESKVKEVWEKSLFHCVEVMKLDSAYDIPTRIRLPFILINLNRDDEAYAFIRYWLKVEDYSDPVYERGKARHRRSEGGDRPYPIELDCRYNEIFQECSKLNQLTLTAPYLLALAIIKARIIASHDAISRTLDFALKQTDLKHIEEVQQRVLEMLIAGDVTIQRQQLSRIFDKIQRDQPSMLADLLEYEFMSEKRQSLDLDETFLDDYPFPINIALANGLRSFYRVPGATDILRQRA